MNKLYILLGIVLAIVIIAAITGEVTKSKFIYFVCLGCNSNIKDIKDCIALLELNKNTLQFTSVAKQFEVDLNKITKIEKRIKYKVSLSGERDKEITCRYWNEENKGKIIRNLFK